MSVLNIVTEILNTPLMITPAKLQTIMGVLDKKSDHPLNLDLSMLSHMSSPHGGEVMAESRPVNNSEQNGIQVIGVGGSLINRHHGFNGDSGLRSYEEIRKDVSRALHNPDVGGMLLDINSYGGTGAGCERVSRFIKEADAEKPIYGVVDLNAFSAGFSIASACRKIILTDRTAGVGSIGCIAIHCEYSGYLEKEGINYTIVTFGKHKADMNMYEPLSKEQIELLQRSVDGHGLRFTRLVSEFRGLELDRVLETEARCFTGKEAIDIGLADEIASFEDAVAMMADEIRESKRTTIGGFNNMTTKERMEGLLQAEDGPSAITELGYLKKVDLESSGYLTSAQAKEKVTAALNEQLGQINEVMDVCKLGQASVEMAAQFIREGCDAKKAGSSIQQERANNSRKTVVNSTITPVTADGQHPLVEACRAMKK